MKIELLELVAGARWARGVVVITDVFRAASVTLVLWLWALSGSFPSKSASRAASAVGRLRPVN